MTAKKVTLSIIETLEDTVKLISIWASGKQPSTKDINKIFTGLFVAGLLVAAVVNYRVTLGICIYAGILGLLRSTYCKAKPE